MRTKVMALGNRLMTDDGIAIRIVEELKPELETNGFEVFIGETDTYSCLDFVKDGDSLILIDSTYLGKEPGTVSIFPLKDMKHIAKDYKVSNSMHDLSFIKLLALENKIVKGYFIGIEVAYVDMGINLSPELEMKFSNIKENIKNELIERGY
ncbi:hydrogenase maturation protease [Clostridium grantii]|uniref:Hydrogenase maturation protease n=1 Tax=Clostridium grantii DSM 8605 TaxID=1121316 RepID=A0A1M5VPN1_9CLOT|nr:hydrogenase maturation protease [Clostridium grantii]SHH76944.1 hydrogenase maturation protease [Clostridium grantii DSM 8605]